MVARTWRSAAALAFFALVPGVLRGEEPVRRPRIGLALGGGSARGIAHVGVLRWLEEHRVPVDAIAGSSTGAFVGGAYATGMSASEIHELLHGTDWDLMMRPDMPYARKSFRRKEEDRRYPVKVEAGLRHGFRLQTGINSGHRVGLLVSRLALPYSAVESFDELPIPFRSVATDLQRGESVVLDRGPLGLAVRASMALPGTYDPVVVDGRELADGGILDNVPVDVAKAMGADVVIAVTIVEPAPDKPPEGVTGVVGRTIDLMMQGLSQPRLLQADVVLEPDVSGVRGSDYGRYADIEALGYKAAEAKKDELLRYALDASAWERHRQALEARRRPSTAPVTFVQVHGVSEAAADQIVERLEPRLHRELDLARIDTDLDWLVGTGRYASAMYRRVKRGDQEGLCIDVRDKSYAPPFVRFALDLANQNRDVDLVLGSRVTFADVTGLGSEWHVDAGVGSTLFASTELIQPLGGHGAVRRGAFVAPRAFYWHTNEDVYVDGELAGLQSRQRAGAGLDAGFVFGRNAELRAGYEAGHSSNMPRVGTAVPAASGPEQSAHVSFDYEGQDRAHLAMRGVRFVSRGVWTFEAPDAPGAFGRVEGTFSAAWRVAPGHSVTFYTEGATSFGDTPPLLYQTSLGGPFRLGALPPHAERGPNLVLGGIGYRRRLPGGPNLLYDRLYVMLLGELGSAFDRSADAEWKSSFSAGLAADTLFGPMFVGASIGSGGKLRAYLVVGSLVR